MKIEPFAIDVPEPVLADLRERLARTRFPKEMPQSGWSYGAELATVRELVEYWRDDYDWRAAEAGLNRLPQFRAEVGGLAIHLIHVKGNGPKPLPLVLTHGWPGSVAEFTKVIGPLADPASHGGDPADAFDVVVPSMPGYGFSDPAREPGMDPARIAGLWTELMAGLGYERFGAQGGDWGAVVTTHLGRLHAERIIGIHLNMVVASPPDRANPAAGLDPTELKALGAAQHFNREESGYQKIQATKPQTLAFALNDSPAGLAAWIVEKFRTWSDCGGDVYRRFTRDELLTNVMFYWVPEAANASARLYCESFRARGLQGTDFRVPVPTGCAIFPREIFRPARAWVERQYDLRSWTVMPRGGHFAAMEEPELLVDDIRAFFRPLR